MCRIWIKDAIEMTHVYLLNEGSRAAIYGIGTYIRQMTECLQNIPFLSLHTVNLFSERKEFLIEKTDGIETIDIPSIQPASTIHSERYYRHAWYLIVSSIHIEQDDSLIFHLNYYEEYLLVAGIKKVYPQSRIYFTVHYQDWCFLLLGNTSYFRKIIHQDKNILKTDKEKSVYASYEKELRLFNEVDKIICLSQYTKSLLREEYRMPEEKLLFIPNGLKDEYIPRSSEKRLAIKRNLYFKDDEKIVLFVGRLDEVKGVDLLIKAFEQVSESVPCHLVIVGDGHYESCLKAAENYWYRMTFTGRLTKEALYPFYQIADVGVMPSFHEQCSYVAMEMMMFDVPLIVSTTTGLKEMVEDDDSKIEIEEHDETVALSVERLAEIIRRKLTQKSVGSRDTYIERYEIKNMECNYMELYQHRTI